MRSVIKNTLITVAILGAASLLCFLLMQFVTTDTHVPLIFVLAVLCVSRFTSGYVYGIVASIGAVIGVNFAFTYPYFKLNFTLTGYPLTFVVMLMVSLIVSTLTTQIKKQEEMRLAMEKEKLRANLLRSVSHDIRTPLTTIVGDASAVLEHGDALSEPEKNELLLDIRREAVWLKRIVENILSITRIGGDAAAIEKHLEPVEEVIGSAASGFEKRNPAVTLTVDVPEELILLPMDPILIEQVLTNLLDNAVIHGGNVTHVTMTVRENEHEVMFAVVDNGKGIDADVFPHLFDGSLPLQRRDSGARGNMRLGLSVCMSIVNAHQGSMRAENLEKGGACFTFTLPKGKEE